MRLRHGEVQRHGHAGSVSGRAGRRGARHLHPLERPRRRAHENFVVDVIVGVRHDGVRRLRAPLPVDDELEPVRSRGEYARHRVRWSAVDRVVHRVEREGVRPPPGGIAHNHRVVAAAAPLERDVVELDEGGEECGGRVRGVGLSRHGASQAAVGVDGVGESPEFDGVEGRGEVSQSAAAAVVDVKVGELHDAELAAEVLALVELDLDEQHVLFLRRELAQARVEPATAVAPLGVKLHDEERGGAGVSVRGAHHVAELVLGANVDEVGRRGGVVPVVVGGDARARGDVEAAARRAGAPPLGSRRTVTVTHTAARARHLRSRAVDHVATTRGRACGRGTRAGW